MSSRAQLAKYCGPEGVVVLPNESANVTFHAVCGIAPRILHGMAALPEIREIEHRCTWNPLWWLLLVRSLVFRTYFEIPNLPIGFVNMFRTNLGGFHDQKRCRLDIQRAIKEHVASPTSTTKHVVLFGCSRGATTTLYTALSLDAEVAKHVSLVIVEAPFDTLDNILEKSSWFPRLNKFLLRALGDVNGPEAYVLPTSTKLNCPIAFITSKADTRVPPSVTAALIADVQRRFPSLPVHQLELTKSRHSAMSIEYDDEIQRYVDFVEGLYDTYCR